MLCYVHGVIQLPHDSHEVAQNERESWERDSVDNGTQRTEDKIELLVRTLFEKLGENSCLSFLLFFVLFLDNFFLFLNYSFMFVDLLFLLLLLLFDFVTCLQLVLDQVVVIGAVLNELVMLSLLDNLASAQYDDVVGTTDC